jgi:hypothetical protein
MTDQNNNATCGCCSASADTSAGMTELVLDVQANVTLPGTCPACGQKGKRVDTATVKALLAVSLRQIGDTRYNFCREASCDVVYFSGAGVQTFTTQDVRERVFQKEPQADDVPVCYCFRHTRGSIRDELLSTGATTVVEDVNAGIQAGQCACDWRNPQGSCCLGNVRSVVKELTEAVETTSS